LAIGFGSFSWKGGEVKTCKVGIKVVPNASRDQIAGWLGDDLKVRVQSPPEDGRANKRLCEVLAGWLDLPKGAVSVVAGQTNQRKTVEICGLSLEEFRSRF
jgi:hypothetical protein